MLPLPGVAQVVKNSIRHRPWGSLHPPPGVAQFEHGMALVRPEITQFDCLDSENCVTPYVFARISACWGQEVEN